MSRPRQGATRIGLLLACLALGAFALARIACFERRPPPAGATTDASSAVAGSAPAETEPVAPAGSVRESATTSSPDPAPGSPAGPEAEVTPRPESVLLTGAAVRLDADGGEHPGLDGALSLTWRVAGRAGARDIEVVSGSFALEVPPDASLSVRRLTLGGLPVELEVRDHAVPADRFLLLRGRTMRGVLLHVRAADDGRELDAVEVRAAGNSVFQRSWQHPGAETQDEALVRAGRSPVLVAPEPGAERAERSYWVRAPGYAWGAVTLDHSAGGERERMLARAGALEVELQGYEDWLAAEVRLWPPDARAEEAYAYARQPVTREARVRFESLEPGTYVASLERGWAEERRSFGQTTVAVLPGTRREAAIAVELPERPRAAQVSGVLVLPRAWERDGVELRFAAQAEASVWQEEPLVVPLSAMRADPADGERFAFEVRVPVAGSYELAVRPQYVHRLVAVPPEGLAGVELVVPPPADVEVRVLDVESGDEIPVERLHWIPQRLEGVRINALLPASADPRTGRVTFRAPATTIQILSISRGLQLEDEQRAFALAPGKNELELRGQRQIGVRFLFLDGEAVVPWSWDWRLAARRVGGDARDVARSIGVLWFREPGSYQLFAEGGIPGYASIDGTPFEVRVEPAGGEMAEVVVRLRAE